MRMPNRGLGIAGVFVIPEGELEWRFDPSGGPGGQHANRSNTRVELSFDLQTSPSVPEGVRDRLLNALGLRAPGGVVSVVVDASRSQWRNRVEARRRLAAVLEASLREPKRRRPTVPPAAARRRRMEAKKRRSLTKRLRRPPEAE